MNSHSASIAAVHGRADCCSSACFRTPYKSIRCRTVSSWEGVRGPTTRCSVRSKQVDTPLAKFHLDRAKELSGESIPLIVLSVESWVSYLEGEYHEALATCEDILDKDPKFFPAMYRKALILAAQSQSLDPPEKNELLAKAVGVLEKAEDGDRNSAVQGARAYILGLSGESVRTARIVRELIEIRVEREKAEVPETRLRELGYVSYFDIAIAWMGLNEHEKTMDALESAFEYADGGIDWLQVLPVFEPLRSKPRFKRLMRQLRYPMVNAGGSKPNTG